MGYGVWKKEDSRETPVFNLHSWEDGVFICCWDLDCRRSMIRSSTLFVVPLRCQDAHMGLKSGELARDTELEVINVLDGI
jgi:hypothetical protein